MLEPNLVEVKNAVEQAQREIGTRFDYKGSSAAVAPQHIARDGLLRFLGHVPNIGKTQPRQLPRRDLWR